MNLHARKWFCAALLLIAFDLTGRPSNAQIAVRAAAAAEGGTLSDKLRSAEFRQAIATLRPLPAEDRITSLAQFMPHASDTSRLNNQPKTPYASTELLPGKALSTLTQVVDPVNNLSENPIQHELLSVITPDQAWAALWALEKSDRFRSSSCLAKALIEAGAQGEARDVLALVAARDGWLARSSGSQRPDPLMEIALSSSNSVVAGQARLWRQALTKPDSPEALQMCFQIWETVHFDVKQREKSGAVSWLLLSQGPAIAAAVSSSPAGAEPKDKTLAHIASIVSEAAFQMDNRAGLNWAVETAKDLSTADADDRLAPAYFHAYFAYAHDSYASAAEEFSRLLFSAEACDISADSGRMLAKCLRQKDDDTGAIAALQSAIQLYPNQTRVIKLAVSELGILTRAHPRVNAPIIVQYLDTHYGSIYRKAISMRKAAGGKDVSVPN